MESVIVSFFTMGAFDMLDIYGLTTLLVLLQLVRKDWHVLVKVISTYVAYWWTAIAIYYGIDKIIYRHLAHLPRTYPTEFALVKIGLGVLSLILAVVLGIRVVRNWRHLDNDLSKVIFIKSVHPVFLAIFGVWSVWTNIPVLWPLFSFLSVLIPMRPSFVQVVLVLAVFTFFSIVPQLAVYLLYRRLEADRFAKVMGRMKFWLSRALLILIPLFFFAGGIWILAGGFAHFQNGGPPPA